MKKPRLDFRALNQILVEDATKDPKALRRELAILKKLRGVYAPLEFWSSLKPTIRLNSLAWFLTDYGRQSLQIEWNAYQIGEAQRKAERAAALESDIQRLDDSLESADSTAICSEIALDRARKTHTVNRKQNALEWADSL